MNPAKEQADKKAMEIAQELFGSISHSMLQFNTRIISTHLEPLYLAVEALRETARRDELAIQGLKEMGYAGTLSMEQIDKNKKSLAAIQIKEVEG